MDRSRERRQALIATLERAKQSMNPADFVGFVARLMAGSAGRDADRDVWDMYASRGEHVEHRHQH